MPVSISGLRRWFAAALMLVIIVVAGTYFYARHRVENALKQVPGKMGIEVQQSAQGFTISKSEQGRTLFKVQASKAIQFKQGGRSELHDVTITIYGSNSSRFDQVYGKEFEYDQQTGDITSHGEVAIDLEANPQGLSNPDQAAPRELKNPIHLRTTNLVFNQKTGDGWTDAPIEFSVPQANGSAVGAKYVARDNALTLESQVRIIMHGTTPATVLAREARLAKNPRQIVLRYPHIESPKQQAQADEATLYLREDNTLDHAMALGNVQIESEGNRVNRRAHTAQNSSLPTTRSHVSAQRLEVKMTSASDVEDAVLSGDVHFNNEGPQPAEASAGSTLFSFGPGKTLTKVHADQNVRLLQHQGSGANTEQDVEVTAPAMDYFIAGGQRLTKVETIGPPQVLLLPADKNKDQTRITADKLTAKFDSSGQLSQVHGEANARVVSTASRANGSPQTDRTTTSDSIDAGFRPGTGVESLVQSGHFAYSSGTQRAFADRARYTPADQILILSGSPRLQDAGMETTARVVRLNRETGDGFAEGDVKTTYNDLKPQPSGALLASSDPVHVTAQSMTAHNNPAVAVYTGNARLWQNANVVEAPSIQFQKERRSVTADSNASQKVSTVLFGTNKSGKGTPVSIVSGHLSYIDAERMAHYDGGVVVHSSDLTVTARQMDVSLAPASSAPRSSTGATPAAPNPAKLEKIVANGAVVITEPNRRGTGDQLVYTAKDEKFVLTGGPPSIFDAEHGKITGVSLTLYRHDDRVIVEGDSSSPAVTETTVVR
jgi:lipopolysaccharide export system protein LptA